MSRITGIGQRTINRGKLKTASASVAGPLSVGAAVTVVLDAYSFFPDLGLADPGGTVEPAGSVPGNEDNPRIRLKNTTGVASSYQGRWRYVAP